MRPFRAWLLLCCGLLALAACRPDALRRDSPPPATTLPAVPTGDQSHTLITRDGRERSYVVHVPTGYDPNQSYPALLMLHGGGGTSEIMARSSGMSNVGDTNGFLVIYPQGAARDGGQPDLPTWNAGGCCAYAMRENIDDVGFMREVVAKVASSYSVDQSRVFVAGMSSGAMMAQRLACEASDVFAGAASVAGSLLVEPCAPSRPIPLLMINGTADQSVPYQGGLGSTLATQNISFPPVEQLLSDWAARNRCLGEPETNTVAPLVADGVTIDQIAYAGCAAPVVLYRLDGAAHSWPGGEAARVQESAVPTQAFDASDAIWAFFSEID